ncbi:MAG: hypothetical protein A2Y76_15630 [Planctomycetes bacterium RBG_13_60_9]|nr:MAG: hypothetical protein A2Y76_15630 [Planctomycetes bacterium RBG_13_60_9]
MARPYINWHLAAVLVVATVVFVTAVFALHSWRQSSRAEEALPLGEQAYSQRNWDLAADQLGRYVSVYKDDTAVLLKYADAQLKRRPVAPANIQHAVAVYQAVLRLEENNKTAAERLIELYLTMGNSGDAQGVASAYLQNNDDPAVRRMLAFSFMQQQKPQETGQALRNLVRDHPDDVLAYEMLGRLAEDYPADANRPAAEWFDAAVAANPQSALAYVVRAAFHRQHGRREQALADLNQARQHDLSEVNVHFRLIQELMRVQAIDQAKEHLTALQQTAATEPMLWQTWAAVVLASGSAQEQATVAETGLQKLAPYPWDFMPTAAELFVAAGRRDRAKKCILEMRQKGLPTATLLFLEGLVANSEARPWEAITRWQEAIAQGHRLHVYAGGLGAAVPVRMMVASAMTQLGDTQSATMQLRTLVSENPAYVEGRMALARLLVRMRNWTDALSQVREVQRIVPGHAEALLLGVQARILLLSEGDESSAGNAAAWQDVEQALAKLDEAMASSVQVKMLSLQAAMRQGKLAEARKILEQIKSTSASDLRVALLEVELLGVQDKPQEAIALLRKLVEQFPSATEPVQSLALALNRQKDAVQSESVVKEAIARMERPEAKRDLGLLLAELYRLWTRQDDLQRWLTDMAAQFPNDVQVKRRLLLCPAVAQDVPQAQAIVDQIKSLEGEAGWQYRYEQAKLWVNSPGFEGRYTETVTYLKENLKANPDDQASRLLLAVAHEKGGQMQLALTAYREALDRSPGNIDVITRTVAALYRAGGTAEYDEADRILRSAGERRLVHPDLEKLELYGQRLLWQDQVRRGALGPASDTLQELVQKDPNDISASLWLALISMQQGRLDEAEVILKELRGKAPESISVIQAQTRLYLVQGRGEEALRLCDETVQKSDHAAAYILRAWTYAGMKENDRAMEDFSRAVARDPNNAAIWVDRAVFYQSLGRRGEAVQDIRKALSLPAPSERMLARVVPLCLASGSRRLLDEAEAVLDDARRANTSSPRLKLLKSQILLSRGTQPSVEQGQQLLREITVAQPELSQAWHLLGRLELGQGQPQKAWDTALGGLSLNGQDKQLLLLKADAEAARSPSQAVPTLRLLAEEYPDDMEVEMRLANALYKGGNRDDARSMLGARMKAEPNNPIPVVTLAGLLISDDRRMEAVELAAVWGSSHPSDVSVATAVARALAATSDPTALKAAEDLLKGVLERNPKSVAAVASLALLMQQMGRTTEAAALSRKVLEIDPNDIIALNNLAWTLCEEDGKYQEALELAERGLRLAPEYQDLIDTQGVIHYRLGHLEKAVEDFSRCIELYPAGARSAVAAYFHLARTYDKMGRKTQAEQHLQQAMTLHDRMGGLSPEDLAEARGLLEQLQKGR